MGRTKLRGDMAFTISTVYRVNSGGEAWQEMPTEAAAITLIEAVGPSNPGNPFDYYPVVRYVYEED